MNNNLYWSIFKNLEKELIHLSNEIHIDDNQLKIYSIKITELLIRTVVEVESISKELYFNMGGSKPNNNELFFDTDCINLIETNWLLSKKKVLVTSPNFHFSQVDNQILTPLKKANKRGNSSVDWLKAYQAVKHNRAENFKKGNLKNLIRALAGLFVLNIYYKDISYDLEKDGTGINFDTNVGGEIFSVKPHINQTVGIQIDFQKNPDFDECIYIILHTDETRKNVQESMKMINEKTQNRYSENLVNEVIKQLSGLKKYSEINLNEKVQEIARKFESEIRTQVSKENAHTLIESFNGLRYKAILNKQQF